MNTIGIIYKHFYQLNIDNSKKEIKLTNLICIKAFSIRNIIPFRKLQLKTCEIICCSNKHSSDQKSDMKQYLSYRH